MLHINPLSISGYEEVIEALDREAGLHAFIAVHSTRLGPSLGGTRMFPYPSKEAALSDVLRLSKAMSYKSALADTGLGGGKSVIIGNPKTDKTPQLWASFAQAINALAGKYIAAEDVGTTPEDMLMIRQSTPYVAALPLSNSSGDPSRFTAFGILQGIRAVTKYLWNSTSLFDKKIVIQGLGNVGQKLADLLFWERAELFLSDIDREKLTNVCRLYGAQLIAPEEVLYIPCDIFAPCALGGIIQDSVIDRLTCKAIAGSANNQLKDEADGVKLHTQGILYAPDYVINAGGIINVSCEFNPQGYSPTLALGKTARIYDTLMTIFERSRLENKPPSMIANGIAENHLVR